MWERTPPTTSPSPTTNVAGTPNANRSCMSHRPPSPCVFPAVSPQSLSEDVTLASDNSLASHDSSSLVVFRQKEILSPSYDAFTQRFSVSSQRVLAHSSIARDVTLHQIREVVFHDLIHGSFRVKAPTFIFAVRVVVRAVGRTVPLVAVPVSLFAHALLHLGGVHVRIVIVSLCVPARPSLDVYVIQLAAFQMEVAHPRQPIAPPCRQLLPENVQCVGPAAIIPT
ncbi:uncharacterized protein PG998_010561 [Apiospora kogelbergensis]|uniref:uncharacterized protein n=1 Tax=Apiospora kogelbergensis TaxID=1337665 RepID=UPI0031313B3F